MRKKIQFLSTLKHKIYWIKIKYYLFKHGSFLLFIFIFITTGIFIWVCLKYYDHINAELILLPTSIGYIATLIGYGIYLTQLKLRIWPKIKEIETLLPYEGIILFHLFKLHLFAAFLYEKFNSISEFRIVHKPKFLNQFNWCFFKKLKKPEISWEQFFRVLYKDFYIKKTSQKYSEYKQFLLRTKDEHGRPRFSVFYYYYRYLKTKIEKHIFEDEDYFMNQIKEKHKNFEHFLKNSMEFLSNDLVYNNSLFADFILTNFEKFQNSSNFNKIKTILFCLYNEIIKIIEKLYNDFYFDLYSESYDFFYKDMIKFFVNSKKRIDHCSKEILRLQNEFDNLIFDIYEEHEGYFSKSQTFGGN